MGFFKSDTQQLITPGTTPKTAAKEGWEVKISWVELTILAPLFMSLVTAFCLAALITYLTVLRPADWNGDLFTILSNAFRRWLDVMFWGTCLLWLCFSGILVRIFAPLIARLELLLGWDLDGGGIGRHGPVVTKLLINANKGQINAEAEARQRERLALEEFIRFIGTPGNTRVRVLNKRFGPNKWPKYKADVDNAGWLEYDSPGQVNSTWHLLADPEVIIRYMFESESQTHLRGENADSLRPIEYAKPVPKTVPTQDGNLIEGDAPRYLTPGSKHK
jgi:hypothetical protein